MGQKLTSVKAQTLMNCEMSLVICLNYFSMIGLKVDSCAAVCNMTSSESRHFCSYEFEMIFL